MQSARHREILDLLRVEGEIGLVELAERLGVSNETIRRDIKKLADQGVVEQVRGGVALPEVLKQTAFHYCLLEQIDEKKAIGVVAARQVTSGDSLSILGGSTAVYFAWELRGLRDLTVVTNSVDIARLLVPRPGNKVFVIGGQLRADNGSTYGAVAAEDLRRFAVSSAFFSVAQVHAVDGYMHDQSEDVLLIRAAMQTAAKRIVLADHTKFAQRGLHRVATFPEIDLLITDRTPIGDMATALATARARVLTGDVTGNGPQALPEQRIS
jgi:DeoR/GlpR family transcriptional regulator of sugar metabolism